MIEHIKQTPTYKSLDSIQQKNVLSKNVRESIRLGVEMTNLTNYENWIKNCSPSSRVKAIVEEIITKHYKNYGN